MPKRISVLAMVLLLSETLLLSQVKDIGTPFIRNFSKSDYRAGTQTWAAAQDLKGFMYFANNDGMLVFDGVQWELYRIPGFSIMRSIHIDDRGEIYIGAYNEIGKMVPGRDGKLSYVSLKNLIPEEYRNFDDVWSISPCQGKIVFQSYNALYIYEEGKPISVVEAVSRFPLAYSVAGRVIVNDEKTGLMELSGTRLIPMEGASALREFSISSILPYDENGVLVISTIGNGLFLYDGKAVTKWDVPVNELLMRDQVFSAATLLDKYFALGTIQEGVMIVDRKGNLIQHINRRNGLQNNTILEVFADRSGNLWLGLDNGIDYVTISSPITFLQNPDGFGAGYAELIHNGKLYLGTNQGLYVIDWKEGRPDGEYRMIDGTYGQVWYLGVHNGKIVCGHNYGTFIVEGENARQINNVPGGWKYIIPENHPGFLLGGTYQGLILFRWEDNTWKFLRKIPGFSESFRVFEEDDNGDIWMSHGFKGVYKVRLSENLDSVVSSRFYTVEDGLPTNYTLNVFRIKDRIIFTGDTTSIYEFVPESDRFRKSAYFNQLVSPVKGITYLKEDSVGNIWYVSNNRIGLFRLQEDYSYRQITSPFTLLAGSLIHGFETVYTYSGDQVLISIGNGFAHYAPHEQSRTLTDFSTYITKIEALYIDSILYPRNLKPGTLREASGLSLPYRNNQLRFHYSSPVYDNQGNIEYSSKLEGYDQNWSEWSSSWFRDFSNLKNGRYTFLVRARDPLGIPSISDSLSFTIQAPWYKSAAAYIAYSLTLLTLFLLLRLIINRRIEISNKRERLKQQREYNEREREYIRQALVSEKEIITMKNEKLQSEKKQRDKELANQAMNIVRKNEILTKIREDLVALKKSCTDNTVNEKVVSIISTINREVGHNKQKEVFDKAFDEVHEAFIAKLRSSYPSLTPTELRLCAFMKMNIPTKEIAPLMNISVRGVEICRYRIRKKLGIQRETNLTSFLLNI
jgi:ligand-binding sensor domain-containing protein/DNA-binding CsgD family transcriptional regulator